MHGHYAVIIHLPLFVSNLAEMQDAMECLASSLLFLASTVVAVVIFVLCCDTFIRWPGLWSYASHIKCSSPHLYLELIAIPYYHSTPSSVLCNHTMGQIRTERLSGIRAGRVQTVSGLGIWLSCLDCASHRFKLCECLHSTNKSYLFLRYLLRAPSELGCHPKPDQPWE
jgi:hypothetical protein